jgi:predicted DNA-binding transcriptional regulator AlpA
MKRGDRQDGASDAQPTMQLVTVEEFAQLARLSRRQVDRLRKRRPKGFPREIELGSGLSKFRSCPRFVLAEVEAWIGSRALW